MEYLQAGAVRSTNDILAAFAELAATPSTDTRIDYNLAEV